MPVRNTVREMSLDLDAFARELDLSVSKVRRKIALDLFGKVSDKTPVLTGRAKGSWAASDDVPSDFVAPEEGFADRGPVDLNSEEPFASAWIVNNLPYITALEFGHSGQAPAGMVRVSMAEIEAEVQAIREDLS